MGYEINSREVNHSTVILNSGVANACTGVEGEVNNRRMAAVAKSFPFR